MLLVGERMKARQARGEQGPGQGPGAAGNKNGQNVIRGSWNGGNEDEWLARPQDTSRMPKEKDLPVARAADGSVALSEGRRSEARIDLEDYEWFRAIPQEIEKKQARLLLRLTSGEVRNRFNRKAGFKATIPDPIARLEAFWGDEGLQQITNPQERLAILRVALAIATQLEVYRSATVQRWGEWIGSPKFKRITDPQERLQVLSIAQEIPNAGETSDEAFISLRDWLDSTGFKQITDPRERRAILSSAERIPRHAKNVTYCAFDSLRALFESQGYARIKDPNTRLEVWIQFDAITKAISVNANLYRGEAFESLRKLFNSRGFNHLKDAQECLAVLRIAKRIPVFAGDRSNSTLEFLVNWLQSKTFTRISRNGWRHCKS